jgi:RNA recognition motif-containing protein
MPALSQGGKRRREEYPATGDAAGAGAVLPSAGGVREHTLFVGNLAPATSEADVIALVKPHGTIVKEEYLWWTYGPQTGQPRGYAFVELKTREQATAAREALHGRLVHGKPLAVKFVTDKVAYVPGMGPVLEGSAAAAAAAVGGSGGGGGGGRGRSDREYKTPEEREQERREAAAAAAGKGHLDAATLEVLEAAVDAKMAAIRAQLARLRAQRSGGRGAAVGGAGGAATLVAPAAHGRP